MFKNNDIKLLLSGILFLILFSSFHTYISMKESENIRNTILVEETKSITSLFKSFRKVYLDIFVENHIKIDKNTLELLPVKTTNRIGDEFAKSIDARVILRTVSDRPRNPSNKANIQEMKIIKLFKKSKSKQYIFKKKNEYIYNYYEPLYITKTCLKCHGQIEDAPKLIKDNYTKAFNYKLGELRGIISLEIDKSQLLQQIEIKNDHTLLYIIINIFLLTSTILFLYYKLKRNHIENQRELIGKNRFLERKAKEFLALQNAIGVSEIVSTTDINGVITDVNDKFCKVSGYSKKELIGHTHNIIRHPDTEDKLFKKMWSTIKNKKVFRGIIKNRKKDGTTYHVDSTIVPILNEKGNIIEYIALRHSIDDIMNHKVLLQDIIKTSKYSVLMIIKIDTFEELENFYTADIISKLENKFFKTLLKKLPIECTFDKVYKLENGEFALIKEIENCDEFIEEKTTLIEKFQKNMKCKKFSIDNYEFQTGILISFSTGKDDIYENAKLGLKKLLQTKKVLINANGLASQVREETQKNIDTINMIKKAIETDNILSYFQPLYNNKTKKIEKYESLVRLKKEDGTILSPYLFLEASKKGGYYNHITKIVLKNSFDMLHKINEDISINLSFLDIEDDETRNFIYDMIESSTECHRVVVELLEDETAKDFELIKNFIQKIKSKGIKIAIDDFGSGYSNFERLLEYQPDILKIDGTLIKNIATDPFSMDIVQTMVTFAKKQKMQVIAEFIENEEIFDIINSLDIEFSQGYFIGKPEPL